jgi:hypothetical protein
MTDMTEQMLHDLAEQDAKEREKKREVFISPGVNKTVAALDEAIANELLKGEIRPGVVLTGIAIVAAKTIAEIADWPEQQIDDVLEMFIDQTRDVVMLLVMQRLGVPSA